MRFAFHTPLKPLDHPVPSGDRAMARALAALLERLGHRVDPLDRHADHRPGVGAPDALPALRDAGRHRAEDLVTRWHALAPDDPARPTAWFTYHLWYKRPDWIGPAVARALAIPYIVAEASYAPKRAGGPWDLGHRAVADAVRAADLVLTLNPDDAPCLLPLLASPDRMVSLPPFLDAAPFRAAAAGRERHRAALRAAFGWPAGVPVLIAVAMMRPPDKLQSYRVLAEALSALGDRDWRLLVVGDGEARAEVERAFAAMSGRVAFAGVRTAESLPALYAAADIHVWPAVNEAYGIGFLEAQAAGLPVVAGHTRGVPAVVGAGESGILAPLGDAPAFARAVAALLDDPAARARLAAGAAARIARLHDLDAAGRALAAALAALPAASP
ncbi:MAG: glycosyltransferase family 4 protein [Rhodospirillales bacterium]|nr:MAG: glycosyltransferase family 4 protein [Rhodospirillales bacterium]